MHEKKLLVGTAIMLLGAVSFAQQALTRDEVRAEFVRAQTAGEIDGSGEAYDGSFKPAAHSGVYGRSFAEAGMSREAVVAELNEARAAGLLNSVGEAWDGTYESAPRSGAFGRPFGDPMHSSEAAGADLAQSPLYGAVDRQFADYIGGN